MSGADDRQLVLVVGVGRSGTSLLSGILGQLGLHIPQPEVNANSTNPRGFGEPRWVVDFHTRLLKERRVTVNDARPVAWADTGRSAESPAVARELNDWLRAELDRHGAVVVKDPRTSWFLPLWMRCSSDLGVPPVFVTMLRHPAETLASAQKSYGTWQTPASRAAAWLNVSLETEFATRGQRRAFVRYEDLLDDWRREVDRVGADLGMTLLTSIDPARAAQVDAFVDPTLHRNRVRWVDLDDVPGRLQDMGDDVLSQLEGLAAPGGDTPAAQASLDTARAAFGDLYAEAEATAQSSITAAKKRVRSERKPPAAPPSLRVRLTRRVPKRYRKRARGALRRLRGSRS